MMLRSLVVLLLVINLLVLSWTAGIFSRWGWGPVSASPEAQAQTPLAAEALQLNNVQSSTRAAPAATPSSSMQ
ncbi:MAG: hypothetical protein RLZ63_2002 [Pseudomonadota bacterium]|jgi:hypothetical protein